MISVDINEAGIAALKAGPLKRAVTRALRKAGATALRDMRSEAGKRIRARKRIRPKYIAKAITLARPKGGSIEGMAWGINVSGEPVPLVAYPHRKTSRGITVEVNKGKRTLLPGAFGATLASSHAGIFRRVGDDRLPIRELRGSRPVDALLHKGEAEGVAKRGATSFNATFHRLLPTEIGK